MRYVVPLLIFALSGCGDGNSSDDPKSVDPTPFVEQLVTAHCERVFSCCEESDLDAVFVGQQVTNVVECESSLRSQLGAFFVPAVNSAQEAGTVALDASQFTACGSALRAVVCSDFTPGEPTRFDGIAACDAAFSATLETSGFCQADFECKSQFCSRDDGAEQGSCKVAPTAGEPCENDRCDAATYCDGVSTICVEKLANDAECTQNEQCLSGRCTIEVAVGTCEAVPQICQGGA